MVKREDYFKDTYASALIVASAVCAIGWGVINAIFIKSVDMEDINVIKQAIKEGRGAAGADPEKGGSVNPDEDEDAAITAEATEVLAKLTQVGDLITTGAI